MDFDAVLAQVHELLQRQGRVSYRALRLRFQLDDETLVALKDELIYAERVARDEEDRVLVSRAERKCIAAAAQRCVRWRDEKGPARGPSHFVVSRPAGRQASELGDATPTSFDTEMSCPTSLGAVTHTCCTGIVTKRNLSVCSSAKAAPAERATAPATRQIVDANLVIFASLTHAPLGGAGDAGPCGPGAPAPDLLIVGSDAAASPSFRSARCAMADAAGAAPPRSSRFVQRRPAATAGASLVLIHFSWRQTCAL